MLTGKTHVQRAALHAKRAERMQIEQPLLL
jgi:hypothetical protein